MDIRETHKFPLVDIKVFEWISVFNYLYACMGIRLDIYGFLWISMHGLVIDSRSRETLSIFLFLRDFNVLKR